MTKIDQACALLADLLKEGACDAAEILATAEGANISERTAQRAAEQMGIVKSKAGFDGGWTWALTAEGARAESGFHGQCAADEMSNYGQLPESANDKVSIRVDDENTNASLRVEPEIAQVLARVDPEPSRAKIIASRLRKWEAAQGRKAPIFASDPRLVRLVEAGITDADLREAYDLATTYDVAPLTVGRLETYVKEIISASN